MDFPLYPRRGGTAAPPPPLPRSRFLRHADPGGYQPDPGVVDAANAALLLGQPLLVTGEPGTGKTELAYHLAWSLGMGAPLVFDAKSTSTARDLFYTFDTVGRFRAGTDADPRQYLTYEALGAAILLAHPRERVEHLLPPGFEHDGPRRTVVLIDEVDKSPRDFPNDILNEVERMRFRVPELGSGFVSAPDEFRPVLVITSNSEKNLPDAFLRRCVYYDIPFPDPQRLLGIVLARVHEPALVEGPLLDEALDLFWRLRQEPLRKPPATAELLGWLEYLSRRTGAGGGPLRAHREVLLESLGTLLKNAEDQHAGRAAVMAWIHDGR